MSRVIRTGQIKTPTASAGYIAYYPCLQAATDTSLIDRSGQGNHGSFNSLTTGEAWVASNCLSNPTTASHHVTLAKTALQYSSATLKGWQWNATRRDSLFIAFRAKITLPAANNPFMGNANGTGEGGIKFNVDNAAKLQFAFYDKINGTSQFSAQSAAIDASWAANYHSVALHLDGPNNAFTAYADGVPLSGLQSIALASVTVLEPQTSTFDWTVNGASQVSQVTGTAMAMQAFHMLSVPQASGSIARPDHLAMRLHRSPFLLVSGGTGGEVPY